MQKEIERWYKKMWETKGARFIASKRYKSHHKLSTLTVSLVSVYIIMINLLVLFPERPLYLSSELITFTTISLSLIVLVVSVFLSSRGYKYISDKFHDCGREITKLYEEVCYLKGNPQIITKTHIDDISKRYHEIISKYENNHSELDYKIFQRNNIKQYIKDSSESKKIVILFNRFSHRVSSSLKYFFTTQFFYYLFIFSPLLVYYFVTN